MPEALVRYFTRHGGGFRFQIRVPTAARPRYGTIVRVDLQTQDARTAKLLSLRLAAEWLTRFSALPANDDPELALPPNSAPEAASQVAEASLGLTSAFEYWRDLTPDRPARTVIEFERTAEAFDEIVRKPLSKVSRRDIANFRDTLLTDGLSAATVKKNLGFVSTLIQTQFDAGILSTNIAQGLRVPRRKVPKLGRTGFTPEQLEAVFSSPVFSRGLRPRGGGGEAAAWLPILAYATGARVEELCQLRTEDLSDHPHCGLVIRIHDDGAAAAVKTASSRRLVPIHADVIAAGFSQYVELRRKHRDEWLFPALQPDVFGNRSGNWVKWWSRYLRNRDGCNIGDSRVVFHSFRHSFKTSCRAPAPGGDSGATLISEEVHDALTGHTGASVSRSYGVVPLETLVAAIERLRLPVPIPKVPAR